MNLLSDNEVRTRIKFALAIDRISRAFNITRIVVFVLFIGGIISNAVIHDHLQTTKLYYDVGACIVLAWKVGTWSRFIR